MANNIESTLHNLGHAGENLWICLPSSLIDREQTFILYEFSLSMFFKEKSEKFHGLSP